MPRSPKSTDAAAPPSRPPRRAEILREARILLGFATLLLVLVALLAYDPSRAAGGVVGSVGAFLARWTFRVLGLSAFLLLPLALFWTGLAFFRKGGERRWERASGLALVVLGTAGGLALTVESSRYASLALGGPGGELGALIRDGLVHALGGFGALLVLLIAFLVGLALFTDWLVFEMAAEAVAGVKALLPWLRRVLWPEPSPEPAPAAAGAAGASAAPGAVPAGGASAAVAVEGPPARPSRTRRGTVGETPAGDAPDAAPDPASGAPATDASATADPPRPSLKERLLASRRRAAAEAGDAAGDDGESPATGASRSPAASSAPAPPPAAATAPGPAPADPAAETAPSEGDGGAAAAAPAPAPAAPSKGASATGGPSTPPPAPRDATPPRPRKVARRTVGDSTPAYEFPPIDLLDRPRIRELRAEEETIQENARVLERTLADFKIDAQVVGYTRGPVVTMYEISLAAGIKVTRIHSLADDLAMALKAQSVRVVAPIPGKSTVGVEVPNPTRDDVRMRGLLETETFQRSKAHIPLLIGVDAGGAHRIEDLTTMPHLLIAGATGAGKSVCINSIIMSVLLARTPDEVKLILIDPKQVELSFFAKIPHLLAPVVTDMKRAGSVLEWAVDKMEERYDLLARMQVRSIASYNDLGPKKIRERCEKEGFEPEETPERLPYVVIVVDELADLMMTAGKEIEVLITRLAQKSRAVGIHVVLATQRPSTDVITGLIKANMPTRICFKVTSKVDSRVVMDQNGGDRLLGQGDMLYLPPRSANLLRAQATFVSDAEVKRVVEFLAERHEPMFNRELTQVCTGALLTDDEKDDLYDQAVRIVLEEQRGSASLLQRALEIGYTRASRLLDLMRREGIVGAYKGSKASEVLCTLEDYEARRAAAGAAGPDGATVGADHNDNE